MSDIKNEIKQALEDAGVLPWQYRELHRTIEYDAIQDSNGKNIICISSYDQANVDFLLLAVNNIPSLITTIESQNSQIESLKAITELAVNALKDISSMRSYECDWDSHTYYEKFCGVEDTAINTLSEIEKLQNG